MARKRSLEVAPPEPPPAPPDPQPNTGVSVRPEWPKLVRVLKDTTLNTTRYLGGHTYLLDQETYRTLQASRCV